MRSLLTAACLLALTAPTQAHFIWVNTEENDDGTTSVHLSFGEDASDGDASYLERIKEARLHQVTGDKATPLDLVLTEESLSASVERFFGRSLFVASHDYGVINRGESKFRLQYYAKNGPIVSSSVWQKIDCTNQLKLDVVPEYDDGQLTLTVRFDGKPLADAEVKASGPGLDDFVGSTNEDGQTQFAMADAGVYSIRAKHVEALPGKLDGQEYPETRHYSTIVVNVPAPAPTVPSAELARVEQPVTSFGAAISAGKLYMYGGHTGSAHSYSRQEQGNSLIRLNLETREWEKLADGPHLQGLALVAHDSKLYRIGGFTAKNAEGEDHDLWSQSGVAVFDPAEDSWSDLPPLPEPRSSFDAAVLGDAIYVIGGWTMQGEDENHWHTTAWKLDLSQASPTWQPLPSPPFQRRALAVAAHNGKLYAIGGMQEEGGPTRQVSVFDPQSSQWQAGPEILGEDGLTGFGASAFATGGQLYVSTIKGTLQRLSEDGSAWDVVGETPTPRFFHRLLPLDKGHLLVVGGASMEVGKFDAVESLFVAP